MTDSIYYTSNSFSSTYSKNNRSSFKINIEQSHLSHMRGENLYAAIKSITVDNTFETVIEKIDVPHLIIACLDLNKSELIEEKQQKFGHGKVIDYSHSPDLESGNDYLFYNFDPQIEGFPYAVIGNHNQLGRGFTDVKIYVDALKRISAENPLSFIYDTGKFNVLHNISLHPTSFKSAKEFVAFLNSTFHKLSFDIEKNSEPRHDLLYYTEEGKCLFFNRTSEKIKIYMHSSVAHILGFTKGQSLVRTKKKRKKRSVDYTSLFGLGQTYNEDISDENPRIIFLEEANEYVEEDYEKEYDEPALPYIPPKKVNTYFEYEMFGGYEPPKLFGQISFIEDNKINSLLFDTDGVYIYIHNNSPDYLKSLENKKLKYEYYFIEKFTKFKYVLSEKKVDPAAYKAQMLALRASYSVPDICNNGYDTLVAFINTIDLENGVVCNEYKSPTYYLTSIEKLCRVSFNLIDIETGKAPKFSTGHPTYIHVKLQKERKMYKQFNAFFDSSDKESLKYFPDNTNSDFRIRLPQRLEFNRSWSVCLKSIFLGNDLFNIFSEYCYITYKKITEENTDKDIIIRLKSARYVSIDQIFEQLNSHFEEKKIPIEFSNANERSMVVYSEDKFLEEGSKPAKHSLAISSHLSMILGFSRNPDNVQNVDFNPRSEFIASYEPDMELLTPQNYMILLDIVQSSVFGSGKLNILKMLSSKYNKNAKVIYFDNYIDEYIPLSTYDFSVLRFTITDSSGNIIRTDSSYPTRLKLQFIVK